MSNIVKNFHNCINNICNQLINEKILDQNTNLNNINIDIPSDENRGDISTNAALIFRKFSSLNTMDLANIIKDKLLNIDFIFDVIVVNPGFINVFFTNDFLIDELKNLNTQGVEYGSNNIGKDCKINIEYVSANPTGPLHVAHSRGAVFGDVLSNLLEFCGYEVTREYYVNDSGSQIIALGESLYKRYKEQLNIKDEDAKIHLYPGKYLIDIANEIIKTDGDKWINTPLEDRAEYFQNYAIKNILKGINDDLNSIGIYFDKYSSEKDIIKKNYIEKVFSLLKDQDLLYLGNLKKPKGNIDEDWESRKQLLFKSTSFGDESDRPFKKSNNDWTYFANDSAYHYDKLQRGYKKLINIWGSDHIGYVKRMKSMVRSLSNSEVELEINICQLVHLKKDNKPIKMSKRTGNFITLKELTDQVGSDALRYFMLRRKNDAQMDFDLTKVIEKNNDNPIFYINYALARSNSLIEIFNDKIKKSNNFDLNKENFNKYLVKEEWKIIKKLLSWPHIVENCAIKSEPHRLIYYLEELSALFHSFWNLGKEQKSLRFIDENNLEKTICKIYIIKSMQNIFKCAYKILGIKIIDRM